MGIHVESKGMLLIISGPSGAGKGTLCKMLLEKDPSFSFSCSVTTRGPRPGEVEGEDYHFIDEAQFQTMIDEDLLLEYATVHGHLYGTPKQGIEEMLRQNRNIVLDIDSQGAMNVMKRAQEYVSVFIMPPSYDALRRRLERRNAERPEEIERRLCNGRVEMQKIYEYQYVVINDIKQRAFDDLMCIVNAEKLRTNRCMPSLTED